MEIYVRFKCRKSERIEGKKERLGKKNGQWKESSKEENIVFLIEGNIVFLGNSSM